MQKMQMQIMGAVAEYERSMINERASEGRAIAKAKGVLFGRKPTLSKQDMSKVRRLHASGKSVSKLAIDFDVSRPAI
jgi:DNA invertase Pin-like site-specific DNA recombinase